MKRKLRETDKSNTQQTKLSLISNQKFQRTEGKKRVIRINNNFIPNPKVKNEPFPIKYSIHPNIRVKKIDLRVFDNNRKEKDPNTSCASGEPHPLRDPCTASAGNQNPATPAWP